MGRAVHLVAGVGRTRCNRQGMASNRQGAYVAHLDMVDALDQVTCADCRRLAAGDANREISSPRAVTLERVTLRAQARALRR